MKTNKIIYWASTGLLSALLLMSAGMYVFNNAEVSEIFIKLGYPTYIMYPLAFAKISAVIVILSQKISLLKEWAYAGLFFNLLLATSAHINIHDGEHFGAIIALVLLITSYIFHKKVFSKD